MDKILKKIFKMNHWIGVIGKKLTYERFLKESNTWFCMPNNSSIDDLIIMYVSRRLTSKNSGFFAIYKIVSIDKSKDAECSQYGSMSGMGVKIFYTNVNLVRKIDIPVSFEKASNHPLLAHTRFIRRKMQATYFPISQSEYGLIESLI